MILTNCRLKIAIDQAFNRWVTELTIRFAFEYSSVRQLAIHLGFAS